MIKRTQTDKQTEKYKLNCISNEYHNTLQEGTGMKGISIDSWFVYRYTEKDTDMFASLCEYV